MYFGQPLVVPVTSRKVELPQALDDDLLSDQLDKWYRQPDGVPSLLEYYVQTIKIYNILGQTLITQESASTDVSSRLQTLFDLDNQLLEWRDRLPEYLKYEPPCIQNNESRPVMSDDVIDAQEVLDLPALSKRLYSRSVRYLAYHETM